MKLQRASLICATSIVVALVSMKSEPLGAQSQHPDLRSEKQLTVARLWTGALLYAIRRDLARPTVHARNLYHLSATMFDVWSLFNSDVSTPVFIGVETTHKECELNSQGRRLIAEAALSRDNATEYAISIAAWHLLNHRFAQSRNREKILKHFDAIALSQGIDVHDTQSKAETSTVFAPDTPLLVGKKVARCIIASGLNDRSREQNNYANINYSSVNRALAPANRGNPGRINPNRWQPLLLEEFIDQSGNLTDTPSFLGANWGQVKPFALTSTDRKLVMNNGRQLFLWLDPGMPPQLTDNPATSAAYQFGHAQVVRWSAQLSPKNNISIDISPGSSGNAEPRTTAPRILAALPSGLQALNPVASETGHTINPANGKQYVTNRVLLGDYSRVVAEYWADGPDSETPPGHWFTLYNEMVVTHSLHNSRVAGQGDAVSALEYDLLAYLALGGAMHDSAIAAWSVKRHYDSSRPITAIRYMAGLGQSSNKNAANYHAQGIPLIDGVIESIPAGDPLAGNNNRNVGRIKARVWRGPLSVSKGRSGTAGVGWILLEDWWPYQRSTFVSPPFAGYVSGHSTFSQAAAEVLTELTGDAFFPGGIAEFIAYKNEFLSFEKGPSSDVKLQWATYRDAAEQSGLSRIWGGIHPLADHVAGQRMGAAIGVKAWWKALSHYRPGKHIESE